MYTLLHISRIDLPTCDSIMATEVPDPRTFRSWEDAFQYPIPTVQKLERQLRTTADDNREKLRSLVGYVQLPIELIILGSDNSVGRATAASSTPPKPSSIWKHKWTRSNRSSAA
jgi:hypothetical protein